MNFALIGAAGYVAPRHMQAIKDTGHQLIAALDPHDSVGILDKYFPECEFFTDEKRFDRHCVREKMNGNGIDVFSICSPNHLHESHCKMGLRLGGDVICEKPLAVSDVNLDQLKYVEQQSDKRVYSILQLRLHPSIIALKKSISPKNFYKVTIDYITPRGPWYFQSWKGKIKQSGGIETNIGIHFFDMLIWLFGEPCGVKLEEHSEYHSRGYISFQRAIVDWFLSINRKDLPEKDGKFYRRIVINNEPFRFDDVFSDLHTESYKQILDGNGFGIDEVRPSIKLVSKIRSQYKCELS